MGPIQLVVFGFIAIVLEASQAQYIQTCRMRSYVPTRTIVSCPQEPCRCCCTSGTEDLNKLVLLAKLLIEKNSNNDNNINGESIIKKLIDALIYTTLQYNQCRATLELLIRGGKGGNNGSLIDLNLLNPNSPNNILDLGLGGQDVLGIGLGKGGGGSTGGSSENSGGSKSKGGSGSGAGPSLIDLGLLRPNQDDNVVDLDIVGQDVLGVGIGKRPGGSPGGKHVKDNKGDSGQSLIDVNLLRPDSKDNVLDLNLSGQDVLGIGIGKS